jgi:3-hydroxy-9,10-secoandrosta-1,3,5(10)-triene-9,17-dione monooxygenase reductase component
MAEISPFNTRSFRDALGNFTTGVTIITTLVQSGEPYGLTANSFSSVSLDPPLVLWSLAKTSRCLTAFMEADSFAVHILSCDQEGLAMQFASALEDRFADTETTAGFRGVPLLDGCSARFECEIEHRYDGGDHIILVGRVKSFEKGDKEPLLFHRGRFAKLNASAA